RYCKLKGISALNLNQGIDCPSGPPVSQSASTATPAVLGGLGPYYCKPYFIYGVALDCQSKNHLAACLVEHKSMTLQAEFEQIAGDVKKVKTRPEDQELLDLYGLYKQATVGDVNIDKPGMVDLKGKAKWEAWNSRTGMSKDDAMTAYIVLAKEVINKYGM
ncbi:hypothetical protein MATL_G00134890, partial [Megalops atlanticus]